MCRTIDFPPLSIIRRHRRHLIHFDFCFIQTVRVSCASRFIFISGTVALFYIYIYSFCCFFHAYNLVDSLLIYTLLHTHMVTLMLRGNYRNETKSRRIIYLLFISYWRTLHRFCPTMSVRCHSAVRRSRLTASYVYRWDACSSSICA